MSGITDKAARVAPVSQSAGAPSRAAPRRRQSWLGRLFRRAPKQDPGASLSYRFLARQIHADLHHREGVVIVVSSSVPPASSNEMVLLFSHALAEELSARSLVVDATFGADGIGAALDHSSEPGFQELVYQNEHNAIDLIRPTARKDIAILPAGRTGLRRVTPVDANRIEAFYEQLRGRYDYIVVQQGPATDDTRYLGFAAAADLVLLLVEEAVTPVSDLDRSLEVFGNHQISNVRLVLCETP